LVSSSCSASPALKEATSRLLAPLPGEVGFQSFFGTARGPASVGIEPASARTRRLFFAVAVAPGTWFHKPEHTQMPACVHGAGPPALRPTGRGQLHLAWRYARRMPSGKICGATRKCRRPFFQWANVAFADVSEDGRGKVQQGGIHKEVGERAEWQQEGGSHKQRGRVGSAGGRR